MRTLPVLPPPMCQPSVGLQSGMWLKLGQFGCDCLNQSWTSRLFPSVQKSPQMSGDDLTSAVEACTERADWPIKNARRSAKPAFELEDIGPYLDDTEP